MPVKTVETFPMGRRAALASCCIPILWELGTWAEALGLHHPLWGRLSLIISLALVPRSNLPTWPGFRNPYLPFLRSAAFSPQEANPAAASRPMARE